MFSANLRRAFVAGLLLVLWGASAAEATLTYEWTVGASTTPVTSLQVSPGQNFTLSMWLYETVTTSLQNGMYQVGGQVTSTFVSGVSTAATLSGLANNSAFNNGPNAGARNWATSSSIATDGSIYQGTINPNSPDFQAPKGIAAVSALADLGVGSIAGSSTTLNGNPAYKILIGTFNFTAASGLTAVGDTMVLQAMPVYSNGTQTSGLWNIPSGSSSLLDSNFQLLDGEVSATDPGSSVTITISAVPEPQTWVSLLVLSTMLGGFIWHQRRPKPKRRARAGSDDFYFED